MTRFTARVLFWAWLLIIIAIVVPWGRFTDHSHWMRIDWSPFVNDPIRIRDIVANTLLYIPFGYLHRKLGAPAVGRTLVYALALSGGTECTQVFSPRALSLVGRRRVQYGGRGMGIHVGASRVRMKHPVVQCGTVLAGRYSRSDGERCERWTYCGAAETETLRPSIELARVGYPSKRAISIPQR